MTVVDGFRRCVRRRLHLGVCVLVLSGCVITGPNLPERSGAGVLTTADGAMYLALTPCSKMRVDSIALKYTPRGVAPGVTSRDEVVLMYTALAPLPAADVLAPLDTHNGATSGLQLTAKDDELLRRALGSIRTTSFDDSYFVEVRGHREDGSTETLGGTWSADMSRPNSVVLGNELFTDPGSRHCGLGEQIGWRLPPVGPPVSS